MSSGFRNNKINTQERAVSTDINRLQAFAGADLAEILRELLSTTTSVDDPSVSIEYATLDTPMRAEILNGLMVRPQIGNFSMFVDAGVAMFVNPDGALDESNYKLVRDLGVSTVGVLVIGANGSGQTRIDVIECRPNPIAATVTDNRDIFNPTTGLFVASTVTKETKGVMEYRVRAGTPASGYPGSANGWTPLCIASVPNGATSCDSCTFWDVRPLVSDRAFGIGSKTSRYGRLEKVDGRGKRVSATSYVINGRFEAFIDGRRVGGTFRRGTPGSDANESIDVASGDTNQETSITENLTGHVYVYVILPSGLPRWARYTDASAGFRAPRSATGILVASYTKPDFWGAPTGAIAPPASTGLTASTTTALCVWVAAQTQTHHWQPLHVTNRHFMMPSSGESGLTRVTASNVSGGYTFAPDDTFWPPNARSIDAEFQWSFNLQNLDNGQLSTQVAISADAAGTDFAAGVNGDMQTYINNSGGTVVTTIENFMTLPTPVVWPAAQPTSRKVSALSSGNLIGGSSTFGGTGTMYLRGFTL